MTSPALIVFGGGHLVLDLIVLALYFLPAIIAFMRGHPHPWVVTIADFLLGWTFLGWVACLIWAMVGRRRLVIAAPPGSYIGMTSPDGRWQWDGTRWVAR